MTSRFIFMVHSREEMAQPALRPASGCTVPPAKCAGGNAHPAGRNPAAQGEQHANWNARANNWIALYSLR
jgi:hypothetical protein